MTPARHPTTIVLAITQTLAWGTSYYLPAILAVPIADSLDLQTHWIFAAFSSALIVAAAVAPTVGRWIDRYGGRDVLAGSNLVLAAGLALLGSADSAVLIALSWLVLGFGMAMGLYEAAFTTLAGIHGPQARRAMTAITLLGGLASTIFWPATTYLDAAIGWRMTCFAWAFVHLAVGLPLNLLGVVPATQSNLSSPIECSSNRPRRRRTMILLAIVFTAAWSVSTAIAAHLPRLLSESGLSSAAAVSVAALVGPAQLGGRLLEFSAVRHVHPLLSARLAAMAHPVGGLALLLFGGPAAALFALLHGAGNGILTVAKGTLPLVLFGSSGYGQRQGMLTIPARMGQAVAPFGFAILIEQWGIAALALSISTSLISVAALVAVTPMPRDS